jgi:DNA-binding GntR family transcriptional regulator
MQHVKAAMPIAALDNAPLDPLRPQDRIADNVYASLREAIFEGRLKPGTKLSVPALARQLGVSRSPVREAVLRLTQDQLASEESRRGAVVASIGLDALIRLYEVREVLEGLASRLATERGRPGMVKDLAEALAAHQAAVDSDDHAAHTRADMRFHQILRDNCDNPSLAEQLLALQAQVRLGMLTTTMTAGPALALADHRAIYDAVRAGDADRAEERGRAHIARLRRSLEQAARRA